VIILKIKRLLAKPGVKRVFAGAVAAVLAAAMLVPLAAQIVLRR
jgi:hypothetical protein